MIFDKDFIYKSSHRVLLELHLKKLFKKYLLRKNIKKIVDFGSGFPRYKFLAPNSKWYFFDINPKNKNIIYSNEKNIPIDTADIFLCLEVMQYIDLQNLKTFFWEIKRIIGNDGIGIITIPYLYPINHEEKIRLRNPKNYFSKKIKAELKPFGNMFSMLHDVLLSKIYLIENKYFELILLLFILPLKLIALVFDKLVFLRIASGYFLIIE